jgi:hypothetical protein
MKMITSEAIRWMITHGITNFSGKISWCYRFKKNHGSWKMRQYWSLARNEISNAFDGTEDHAQPEEKQKFKSIRTIVLQQWWKFWEFYNQEKPYTALPFYWVCVCKFSLQVCIKYFCPYMPSEILVQLVVQKYM